MKNINFILILSLLMTSCTGGDNQADAYGNFESVEYLVPAEGQGKIMEFNAGEGDQLEMGQTLGFIDTIPLVLQRDQLVAKIKAISLQREGIRTRIDVLETQKKSILIEKERLRKLLEDDAAAGKQMDDLMGQLSTMESQVLATRSGYATIEGEIQAVRAQIRSVDDRIRRNRIINPVSGTILEKYVESHEMVAAGKTLYKIADLENMMLRAYISGDQLSVVRVGQTVQVGIDDPDNPWMEGTICWISDKSEFTPKIIQTREERVNLVYAIKVEVINHASLKIGMPGEILFNPSDHSGS